MNTSPSDTAVHLSKYLESLLEAEHAMVKKEDYRDLADVINKKNNCLAELLELSESLDEPSKIFINAFIAKLKVETDTLYALVGNEKARLKTLLASMNTKKKQLKMYSAVKGANNNE
ncbi:hypothetical protein [Pseudoalteromonas sp. PAB 2.2]|uniref:hypothetical protein n=1 Tax=Pseudoalteromonas sp. PAB 2.2 TaxID=1841508 RepID=UPI0009500D98|nr:hypothetical protein [Pseudoalteromonas sp. PAB 2.2]